LRISGTALKVLVTDGLDPAALAALRKAHEVDVQELDAEALLAAIPAYHGIIVRSRTKVTKDVLSRATQLKVIGRSGVGVDNIDVPEATARKVVVVNAPAASTVSVAELAIGHIVSLLRHLPEADLSVRSGKWEKARFEGRELFGKTLGLLGSGRIGAEVAKRAQAFGMKVIAHDPYLSPKIAEGLGIRLVERDPLFRDADVLSIHAALTSETRGLVGAPQLAKMKRTAILVNCARGEIVDEAALADALRAGTIAGAAIDVYAKEPPIGSPLLTAPNAVFTPHLGASTPEAQTRAGAIVVEQVVQVLAGRRPEFVVNPKVYD
jgi:D-3-phosphoglycerate dehydrogenase